MSTADIVRCIVGMQEFMLIHPVQIDKNAVAVGV